MKSISPAQHQRLIKKIADLQQVLSYNHHPTAIKLERMSNELQQLYAVQQALLKALAKNVTDYNIRYGDLRKTCRAATTIVSKLPCENIIGGIQKQKAVLKQDRKFRNNTND